MITDTENAAPDQPIHHAHQPVVVVNEHEVAVKDDSPTPREVLTEAGCLPATEYALVHWPEHGPTKALPLDEPFELKSGLNVFFAFRTDGTFFFVLNEQRFEWKRELTGPELRKVGRVPSDYLVRFAREDRKDQDFGVEDHIDLDGHGVEHFYSKRRDWELDVQGELVEWPRPKILVREALEAAGFDVSQPWIITLKVEGQAKRPVTLDDEIDLQEPGIERLRVLKGHVNNGDGSSRRQFSLLPRDDKYLGGLGIEWHTVIDGGRWLLLENYKLPPGYQHPNCTIAIGIPDQYPAAQLDMFFCYPPLSKLNGAPIPCTETMQSIDGRSFQRWSRHHASPWQGDLDCVQTHMGLVDESLNREFEP